MKIMNVNKGQGESKGWAGLSWGDAYNYFDAALGPDKNVLDPSFDPDQYKKGPGNNKSMTPLDPSGKKTDTAATSPSDTMTKKQIVDILRDPARVTPDELAILEGNLDGVWHKTLDELTDEEAQKAIREFGLTEKFASASKWMLVYASQ